MRLCIREASVGEFTQEYALALLLNLSLCSSGKTKSVELKRTLLPLLQACLQPQLHWLRNYIHGKLQAACCEYFLELPQMSLFLRLLCQAMSTLSECDDSLQNFDLQALCTVFSRGLSFETTPKQLVFQTVWSKPKLLVHRSGLCGITARVLNLIVQVKGAPSVCKPDFFTRCCRKRRTFVFTVVVRVQGSAIKTTFILKLTSFFVV